MKALKFKVDIADLKKNISEANKQIKSSQLAFEAATAGMDDWSKSADGLSAKLAQLDTKLKSQKSILKSYEEQQKRQQENYAKCSSLAAELRSKIAQLGDETEDDRKKKREYTEQLKKVENEAKNNASAAESLKDKILAQQAAIGRTEKEIRNYNAKLDDLGKEELEAARDSEKLEKDVKDVGATSEKTGQKLSALSKTITKGLAVAFTALGVAAVAAGKKIWDMSNQVAENGDEIDKQSQKLGISAENYQKLSYAMERCGADVEDFKKGTINISKELANVQKGVDGAGATFAALGVSLKNTDGSLKSAEDVLLDTIDALADMTDETQRNSFANQIFGKSYQELAPLLNSGSEGIKALMTEAEKYGMVMSNDAVKASAAFEDSLTKLKGTFSGVKNSMIGQFLPSITTLMDGFSDLIAGVDGSGEKIKQGASGIIAGAESVIPKAVDFVENLSEAVLEAAPSIVKSLANGITKAASSLLPTLVSTVTAIAPQVIEAGITLFGSVISSVGAFLSDESEMSKLSDAISKLISSVFTKISKAAPAIARAIPIILKNIGNLIIENATVISSGISSLLEIVADLLPDLIQSIFGDVLPALLKSFITSIESTLPQMIKAIASLLEIVADLLPDLIQLIFGDVLPVLLKSFITSIKSTLPQMIKAITSLAVAVLKELPTIIGLILDSDFLPDIISALVGAIIASKNELSKAVDEILWAIFEIVPPLLEIIFTKLTPMVVETAAKTILDNAELFIQPFVEIGKKIGTPIGEYFGTLWAKIKGFFLGVGDWFDRHVIQPVKNMFGDMFDKVKTSAANAWEGIKSAFTGAFDWFSSHVFKPVLNGLIDGVNTALRWTFAGLNGAINNLKQFEIMGVKPFEWVSTVNVPQIPKLEQGGVLKRGQIALLEGRGDEAVIPLSQNKAWIRSLAQDLKQELGGMIGGSFAATAGGKTVNFTQNINSPKQLSRYEIYRQTKNLFDLAQRGV